MNRVLPSPANRLTPASQPWPHRSARGWRQAALLALCAAVPALVLYGVDGSMHSPISTAQLVPAGALWIDARPAPDYSREHVPGALNLNLQDWDGDLSPVFAAWQPPRPIFVYCSTGCSAADEVADKLAALGLEPVKVYEGGFEAWKQASASSGN